MQVITGKGTHASVSVNGVSKLNLRKPINQFFSEGFVMLAVNDESFRREADLTCVCASSSHSVCHCQIDIAIVQNNKRIVSSKLHHRSLQVLSRFFGYQSTAFRGTRETDSTNRVSLENTVDLIVITVNILIFSIVKTCLDHTFLDDSTHRWARIRISGKKNISKEQVRKPALEIQIEGIVERHKIVNSSKRKILDHDVLLCITLNSLRQNGCIVLTVIFAETDDLVDLRLRVSDRLTHLESYTLSCLLEPFLNAVSESLDDGSSFLNCTLFLNLKGLFSSVELGIKLFIGDERNSFSNFSIEWVFRDNGSHE